MTCAKVAGADRDYGNCLGWKEVRIRSAAPGGIRCRKFRHVARHVSRVCDTCARLRVSVWSLWKTGLCSVART